MLKQIIHEIKETEDFDEAISLLQKYSEIESDMENPEEFLKKLLEIESLDEIKSKIELFKDTKGFSIKEELSKILEKKSIDEIKSAIKDLISKIAKYGYPKYGYPKYGYGYPYGATKEGYGYPPVTKAEETINLFNQEILKTGNWNGIEYTDEVLEEIAKNTAKLEDEIKPILKLTHAESPILEKISIGIIKNVRKEGDKLTADFFEVPKRVAEVIKLGAFRGKSAEIYNP
ncbi:MAG: hypothetical protein QW412_03650, partial [Candidatus Aenigmatarchaeota archaeon]